MNLHLAESIPKALSMVILAEEWTLLNLRLATASSELPDTSLKGYGTITLRQRAYAESKEGV